MAVGRADCDEWSGIERTTIIILPATHVTRRIVFLLAIIAFSYLFFFYHLGSYSLKEPDEGRYAEIPREMVEQGDYLVPHLNYVRYFEKPPLSYWVTAASYRLFGINEWAFRFPNALVAFLSSLLLYLFARRRFPDKTAFLGAVMLASSFGFIAMGHIVTIDMLFSGLLFGALLCFNEYYQGRKRSFFYLFYVFLALATLAKGPVALILVFATLLIYLCTEKKLSFLKQMLGFKGLLLYAVIAAPWFIAISLKEKEFFQFFFIDQHVLRFLTTKHKRSGPLYYFVPILLGGMLPWSVFLPRAVIELWRVKELRLFFIWTAVVFAFFSVSGSKLPPYILPVFPTVSIILGHFFEGRWHGRLKGIPEIATYAAFFSCLVLAGLLYAAGIPAQYTSKLPEIMPVLRDIRGLVAALAVVSVIMLAVLISRKGRTFGNLFFMLTGFSLSVVLILMTHTNVIDGQRTTKKLAQMINAQKGDAQFVVNYGTFCETLPFYTGRRIYVAAYSGELEVGSRHDDAKPFFLDQDEFARLFRSDRKVLVVLKAKRLQSLRELGVEGGTVLQCEQERCLVSNH